MVKWMMFVVLWWCFRGGVFVVVFLWWCSCGDVTCSGVDKGGQEGAQPPQ